MEERFSHLEVILDNLPTTPGVYIMKDAAGKIIYVGKAVNLRSRVRSYFQPGANHLPKTAEQVKRVADIETIMVNSEAEALTLEMTLIKTYRPRYNIQFKDDKRFPYIAVRWGQDFPRVEFTRRMERDGTRYFGPYTSADVVRRTLDVLRRAFPYRTCNRDINGEDESPCLYYHIKLCTGPCIGEESRKSYRARIDRLIKFLQGKTEGMVEEMRDQMMQASEEMRFEEAARLRDQIKALEFVIAGYKVAYSRPIDQDILALAQSEVGDTIVEVFFVRQGRLIGRDHFSLAGAEDESPGALLAAFIQQYYDQASFVPSEIVLEAEPEDAELLAAWLTEKRERRGKVRFTIPQRGKKREMLQMAQDNAQESLALARARRESDPTHRESAIAQLEEALNLPGPPNRIEGYDVSTLQGTAVVASRVVFTQGTPRKSEYRRFSIQSVSGAPDDYASMREALTRRFERWRKAQETEQRAPGKKDRDKTWQLLPDLLLVDGGKGQLNVAVEVLRAFDLFGKVPVCGLAKQREEIFLPGDPKPIILPRRSAALYLVQHVRDEAHRFAINYHRTRRRKIGIASKLETIPGVGPARRKSLVKAFGSLKGVQKATEEELAAVPGIGPELARTIKEKL